MRPRGNDFITLREARDDPESWLHSKVATIDLQSPIPAAKRVIHWLGSTPDAEAGASVFDRGGPCPTHYVVDTPADFAADIVVAVIEEGSMASTTAPKIDDTSRDLNESHPSG